MQPTPNLPVIGLDPAKSVFQLHIVDLETGEILRRQVKRAKLTGFFAMCAPSLVAMDACGSAQHWARTIHSLGHQAKPLPAQHVNAFLLRDKTTAMDAPTPNSQLIRFWSYPPAAPEATSLLQRLACHEE